MCDIYDVSPSKHLADATGSKPIDKNDNKEILKLFNIWKQCKETGWQSIIDVDNANLSVFGTTK